MSKEVTLVIITYNSEHIIEECLKPIISEDFDVIVVDNNSSDKTVDKVFNNFAGVKVIVLKNNSGYGKSANAGIKLSNTPYVLVLNPDIYTDVETIKNLVSSAKNFPNAIISAPSLEANNTDADYTKTHWVCGAAMLINKKLLLDNVGYFDENIFLFYEETDLCKRVLNARFEIIKFNKIIMNHLGGISSKNTFQKRYCKSWHTGWSDFYFSKKHLSENDFRKHVKQKFESYIENWKPNEKDPEQEIRNKVFYEGGLAFLLGVKAFDENGKATVLAE